MTLRADTFPLRRIDVPDPEAMLGPDSAYWQLRQRAGLVLSVAKARAALLQIAHPKIAAGLADHSSFAADPFVRVRLTGQTMSAILFGSPAEHTEALRLLRGLHMQVRGTTAAGDSYRATEPGLLWFVLATLIDSDLMVERRFVRCFDQRERDRFYAESLELADAFRVPRSLTPTDRGGLDSYLHTMEAHLAVGPDAWRLGARIVNPDFVRVPRPIVWGYKQILASLLPAALRAGYGLPSLPPPSERAVVATAHRLLPIVPTGLKRTRLQPA